MKRFNAWLDRMLDRFIPESEHYDPCPVSTETPHDRLLSLEFSQRLFRRYFVKLFRNSSEDRQRIIALEQRLAAMEERMQPRTSFGTIAERN
jgi:hypothetical protein